MDRPILVLTDASPVGVAAVLCHVVDNCEKPVMFASATLSESQRRYSQIDREALAVLFAVSRFHKFLWGHFFALVTDNEPIKYIFNPKKGLPMQTTTRLQHWAAILEGYNFTIVHRRSEQIAHVDALSRLPNPDLSVDIHTVSAVSDFAEKFSELPMTSAEIASESAKDPVLSKVMHFTYEGWPRVVPPALEPFCKLKLKLSLDRGCLIFANRVVVPSTLQRRVLELLHDGHPGIVRMKMLARTSVWWPALSSDIELFCKSCLPCAQVNLKADPETTPWPVCKAVFERIHIDFFEFEKFRFFIWCDAYSKYIDAILMPSCTAQDVVVVLLRLIATWGRPLQLVSDNGPPFDSAIYRAFCTHHNIVLVRAPPYHPESNTYAERSVQTVKRALRKLLTDNPPVSTQLKIVDVEIQMLVAKFLYNYRNTPSTATGKSPNDFMLTFKPRTMLTDLHPNQTGKMYASPFREGDQVMVKFGSAPVVHATVMRQLSNSRFLVSIQGVVKQVHLNQMVLAP